MTTLGYALPTTLMGLLILVVALVILWIIVSIPVYVAGKLVTEGKGGLGDAMIATLVGTLAYILVFYVGTFLLAFIIPFTAAAVLSFILALVVWVAVYGSTFDTSWLGGLAIAIVGWAVLVVLDFFLVAFFGVAIPKFYPF